MFLAIYTVPNNFPGLPFKKCPFRFILRIFRFLTVFSVTLFGTRPFEKIFLLLDGLSDWL